MAKTPSKTSSRSRSSKTMLPEAASGGMFNMREAVDLLLSVPEIQEAYTRADIELALDDRGWETFSGANARMLLDVDTQTRSLTIQKSRTYWLRDPLAKQAVRLWTDYCLGNGLTYKAKDAKVQKLLDRFCKDRRNRSIMSAAGQQRSSKKLLVDGDLFFAVFNAKGTDKLVRQLDPLQITELICDPQDEERVLAYKRITASNKTLYYGDWRLDDAGIRLAEQQKDPTTGKLVVLEYDVCVYHVPFDNIGKRGNGLLSSAIDWSREHRKFMESRVALTQALAKFAYKITAKGGQNMLTALQKRLESTVAQTGLDGGLDKQPPPAPGSTWLQNAGLDMAPMPRATGAGDAKDDANSLKLMVSAATNIMLHYFGDPSTGNLATATAMELPMLKSFTSYQQLWRDVYRDLFSIVLEEDEETAPAQIDIDLPPILAKDLTTHGTFITQLTEAFPEAKVPEVLQTMLIAMGINDLDNVMEAIAANKIVVDAQAAKDKALETKNAIAIAGVKSGGAAPVQTKEAFIEALRIVLKEMAA